jgi:hypothetical protein
MKRIIVGMLALALILGFSHGTETTAREEIKPLGFGHIHG